MNEKRLEEVARTIHEATCFQSFSDCLADKKTNGYPSKCLAAAEYLDERGMLKENHNA